MGILFTDTALLTTRRIDLYDFSGKGVAIQTRVMAACAFILSRFCPSLTGLVLL